MKLLLLGGTAEARDLAARLAGLPDLSLVSSLAGRVRDPRLPPGEVRVGGFGGVPGLVDWLREQQVDLVVDATHPYATTMQANAVAACSRLDLPRLRLARPGWRARDGDRWHRVGSLAETAAALPSLGTRVFLTTGRQGLAAFADLDDLWFLIRCVDQPSVLMPAHHEVLLARGPYRREQERALMSRFGVEVLVTKDSGGSLTAGKLEAARDLGLPVVVVRRPPAPPGPSVATVDSAADWVERLAGQGWRRGV
ncbi:MAG TPA: cobalt-precorrin-6A reductase [Actinomycetes bacterium]|nr:cobalt-precorrin-6A reductase [Actinomycetes bacterium]